MKNIFRSKKPHQQQVRRTLNLIYVLIIITFSVSCSDKERSKSSDLIPAERKVGDNLFLNFYSYMSESMYNDSINSLYTKGIIELGNYSSNGRTIETNDYSFTLSDKNLNSTNEKASLLPILEADSLLGIKLVFTIFNEPLQLDFNACTSQFSENSAHAIIDLYISKYGKPLRPTAFNSKASDEHNFFLWVLKDKAIFIRQSTGICFKTKLKSLYEFEIHYINKDYYNKSMWNPDVVDELYKEGEKRVKEKLKNTKESI